MSSDWLFWIGGAVVGLAGLILLGWALFADRSRGRRRCPKCWYDMSKTPEAGLRCSECGHTAKRERRLYKTRRRWRWAFVSAALLSAAALLVLEPKIQRDGWRSIAPTSVLVFDFWLRADISSFDHLTYRVGTYVGRGFSRYQATPEAIPEWQWRMVIAACNRELVASEGRQLRALELISGGPPGSFKAFDGVRAAFVVDQNESLHSRTYSIFLHWSNELQGDSRRRCVLQLIEFLDLPTAVTRRRAAMLLGHFGDGAAVAALERLVHTDDPEIRLAAIRALGEIGAAAREVWPTLVMALSDDDVEVRTAAAESLGLVEASNMEVVSALLLATNADSCALRAWAALSLIQIQVHSDVAFETLRHSIGRDECDAERVLWRLARLGSQIAPLKPTLLRLETDRDAPIYLRNDATRVLRSIASERSE